MVTPATSPITRPLFVWSFKAAADLTTKRWHIMTLTAENTVNVCDAITDIPIGILQNAPDKDQQAEVLIQGISPIKADGALAVGNLYGTSADGQADAIVAGTNSTVYVVGQVFKAGVATAVTYGTVDCLKPTRAA